jgi:RNA polymerase I-specific transcription initiation factor RRN3
MTKPNDCQYSAMSSASPLDEMVDGTVDPRFVLPPCDLPPRNELEPVQIFVAKAVLEHHSQADNGGDPLCAVIVPNYQGILEALRAKRDLAMLTKLMIALRTSGSTINLLASESNRHARLWHALVRLVPFDADTAISATTVPLSSNASEVPLPQPVVAPECSVALADAHFRLLLALISANSVFLVPTITALWKMLTHQIAHAHVDRCRYIHAALATALRLCPQAKTELLPIITTLAPFRMRPQAELDWYYTQSIYVLQYLPTIRGPIMELLVAKCLELDVEIKITDVGDAIIDPEDNNDEALFQLDLDDNDVAQATKSARARPSFSG